MLRESRQKEILNLLNTNGYVEISALCRMFNVTEMTIRRDLDQLAQYNDIERTRGGAVGSETTLYEETRFEHRINLHSEEK
ncbi:transcriptional regulator, DeoR family, partial [[Clostridium] hylemonae DSM 15053]